MGRREQAREEAAFLRGDVGVDGQSTRGEEAQDAAEVVPLFVGKVLLRGLAGDVVELAARGDAAAYSAQVKHALQGGLLVHQARLRFTLGERTFEATLDAEFLDVRGAKLPELLTEEEDDRAAERLALCEELGAIVDAIVATFLEERASKAWRRRTVPALLAWMGTGATASAKRAAPPG